jgi:hypothetical protein
MVVVLFGKKFKMFLEEKFLKAWRNGKQLVICEAWE